MVSFHDVSTLSARQVWATPTRTSSLAQSAISSTFSAISAAQSSLCSIALPAGGILRVNESFIYTLQDSVPFESSCDDPLNQVISSGNSTVIKFSDPFYASVAPQIYALATATIISYILVILIFITPRTFYVGGPGGGANFLGLRSLVPGSGSSSVIGVGRRPLLQKIAAITVAISLTIATADTFRVAEGQYNDGLMDSQALVEEVIGSTEIRVVRVVSDTFLWLAQVQTLIRLFPRHKEKVTIKWLGFALVTCDTIFSILENFVSQSTLTRPRSFQDAIPAMSYLFQMSISLIYASCVIYYSLSKRRFAFWHSKMKNIFLVAALSLASVLIPVVFFVLDVSQPSIASWGEYIRWVGAAAASVVVWEWVERIEALERDERKDGILGREIFDGDEMLDMSNENSSGETKSTYFRFGRRRSSTAGDGDKKVSMFPFADLRPRLPFRSDPTNGKEEPERRAERRKSYRKRESEATVVGNVTRPPQAVTPISRSDTTSAASTVYAVRYHNVTSPSPVIPEEAEVRHSDQRSVQVGTHVSQIDESGELNTTINSPQGLADTRPAEATGLSDQAQNRERQSWSTVSHPFKRKRTEPPAEVAAQMTASNMRRSPAQTYHNLRERFNSFRASQRNGRRKVSGPSPPMPVTVIPAQPRTSRLSVPDETPRASARPSTEIRPVQRDRQSMSSRQSSNSKNSGEHLPVTVIPAPARGARTWSPDDLHDNRKGSSSSSQRPDNPVTTQSYMEGPTDNVITARGTLRIAEAPTPGPAARGLENPDGTIHSTPTNNRAASKQRFQTPPMDSLDDRISSTSPGGNASNVHSDETEFGDGKHTDRQHSTPKSAVRSSNKSTHSSHRTQAQPTSNNQRSLPTEAQDTPPPVNIRDGHSKI